MRVICDDIQAPARPKDLGQLEDGRAGVQQDDVAVFNQFQCLPGDTLLGCQLVYFSLSRLGLKGRLGAPDGPAVGLDEQSRNIEVIEVASNRAAGNTEQRCTIRLP